MNVHNRSNNCVIIEFSNSWIQEKRQSYKNFQIFRWSPSILWTELVSISIRLGESGTMSLNDSVNRVELVSNYMNILKTLYQCWYRIWMRGTPLAIYHYKFIPWSWLITTVPQFCNVNEALAESVDTFLKLLFLLFPSLFYTPRATFYFSLL